MSLATERRILGVDPGLARMGWGIIDGRGASLSVVAYGALDNPATLPHAERLSRIYRALLEAIAAHAPVVMAVEEIFQGKNARSALLAGEGRGACILAGANSGLRVVEYPATVVKLAVTGNGRASKPQVQGMVRRLLGLPDPPTPQDAADALAVAITHLQRDVPFPAGLRMTR